MSANATTAVPTGQKKIAQGKERSDDALGHSRKNTSSPERTKESGELPDGWRWAAVNELSDVVRGCSPRPAGDPRYFGGDIPWITVGPITADATPYLRAVPQTVTVAGKERSRFVEPGTLLLTNSGATLGVPKITLIGGCINDGVAALLNVPEELKLYLLYFLQTQTQRLRGVNQGAAQPNLNTTIIKTISVPLAPPKEQRRIVAEIEKQFTRVFAHFGDKLLLGAKRHNDENRTTIALAHSTEDMAIVAPCSVEVEEEEWNEIRKRRQVPSSWFVAETEPCQIFYVVLPEFLPHSDAILMSEILRRESVQKRQIVFVTKNTSSGVKRYLLDMFPSARVLNVSNP